jgi:cytidylate kinase
MPRSTLLSHGVGPILGAIRSVPVPAKPVSDDPAPPPQPFITISRQPGAGGWTLARHLVEALNQQPNHEEQSWTCWDRELVEKVAADLHLESHLVDSIEDRNGSWFTDFLESMSFSDDLRQADESKVYARVARTIRALAQTGRVVIVGRGGVFITRRMPGGMHVRLVAPFEQRVAFMEREYHLTPDRAAARVKELDRNRQAFYRRYWANETLNAETFTITINTEQVELPAMVQMLVTLVRERVMAAK